MNKLSGREGRLCPRLCPRSFLTQLKNKSGGRAALPVIPILLKGSFFDA